MKDQLPIKISLHWNTFDVEAVRRAGLHVLGGDILLDGALGSHTAALSRPYADEPEAVGILYYSEQKLVDLARQCLESGIQIGLHAIGDRAIKQALSVFGRVAKAQGPGRSLRIDHFGLPARSQIQRAAGLGVLVSTQPTFPYRRGGPGSVYESRLGPDREVRAYPLRELFDAGLLVAGGSDSVVLPADVMLGIHGAVNHPHEDQRLTVDEALQMYTINAAQMEFEEGLKGSLKPGGAGDLILLDRNPYEVKPCEIENVSVILTIVDGFVIYNRMAKERSAP